MSFSLIFCPFALKKGVELRKILSEVVKKVTEVVKNSSEKIGNSSAIMKISSEKCLPIAEKKVFSSASVKSFGHIIVLKMKRNPTTSDSGTTSLGGDVPAFGGNLPAFALSVPTLGSHPPIFARMAEKCASVSSFSK